jgi:hypothetical protein
MGVSIVPVGDGLRWGLSTGVVLLLVQGLLAGIFIWQLPAEIPLFYSMPLGEAQLADRQWFLMLPGVSLGFLVLNWLLVRYGQRIDATLSTVVAWLNALVIFLGLVAQLHILMMVY